MARAPIPPPPVVHGRLVSFYRPVCEAQARGAAEILAAETASRADHTALPVKVQRREYGRFPIWDAIDWSVDFVQPPIAEYVEPTFKQREYDRIPVGAYPDLCHRLAATVGAMNAQIAADNADQVVSGALRTRLRENPELADLLTYGTMLGYSYSVERGVSGVTNAVYRTQHVSTTSMGQAIAALAAYRVDGFDDGLDLAVAIVRDGVLNEFAGLLPPNLLGPSCRNGKGFPEPVLRPTGDGHIELAPELRALLSAEKARFLATLAEGGEAARDGGRGQLGQGCPMARRSTVAESGIDMVAHPFIDRLLVQSVTLVPENRAPAPGLG